MLLGFWRVYCLMNGWRQILCPFASLGVCMFMQATVSHKLLVRLHSGRSPTNGTGTPPSSPSCCVCQGACARTHAHTHTHCRGLSGWCVKAHWIYFWEWYWTRDHLSLPFSFLFCTLPAASSTTSPLTIPLSTYDGVILLWYYDLLLPPWFLILPPLPTLTHFTVSYVTDSCSCKCFGGPSLQLRGLVKIWPSHQPPLPSALLPFPLATGCKSDPKKDTPIICRACDWTQFVQVKVNLLQSVLYQRQSEHETVLKLKDADQKNPQTNKPWHTITEGQTSDTRQQTSVRVE